MDPVPLAALLLDKQEARGPRLHQKYHEACKLVCMHNKTFGFEEH